MVLWFTQGITLQCVGVSRGLLSGSHGHGCYSHALLPPCTGVLVAGTVVTLAVAVVDEEGFVATFLAT